MCPALALQRVEYFERTLAWERCHNLTPLLIISIGCAGVLAEPGRHRNRGPRNTKNLLFGLNWQDSKETDDKWQEGNSSSSLQVRELRQGIREQMSVTSMEETCLFSGNPSGPKTFAYFPGLADLDLQPNKPAEVRSLGDVKCDLILRLFHSCCLLLVLLSSQGPLNSACSPPSTLDYAHWLCTMT